MAPTWEYEEVHATVTGGMRWRIALSAVMGVGWLAFVVIWLFFFADQFSIYRNLAILFLSLVLVGTVIGAAWVGFGLRMGRVASGEAEWEYMRGMQWRGVASLLLWAAWSGLVILWLYFYADAYSGYQNAAVVFVSLLLAAGATAAIWAGVRHYW